VRDVQPTYIWRKGEGSPRSLLEKLNGSDREYAYVLNPGHEFFGVVSVDSLQNLLQKSGGDKASIDEAFLKDAKPVRDSDTLQDILPLVASHSWPVPVLGENNKYLGTVSKNRFLRTLHRAENTDNIGNM
ncbi:MAG TPA: glycine betaine/L-proline ABC transporter ATP-binding protein, partial [Desulfopila sp.]|nr:glycine betaine/L-proline ABC transporter ATP-binding protein [Desulfopila sp.]